MDAARITSHNLLSFADTNWNHLVITPETPVIVKWNDTLDFGTLSLWSCTESFGSDCEWEIDHIIAENLTRSPMIWITEMLDPDTSYALLLEDDTYWTHSPPWYPLPPDPARNKELVRRIDTTHINDGPSSTDSDDSDDGKLPNEAGNARGDSKGPTALIGPAVGIVAAVAFVNIIVWITVREQRRRRREEEARQAAERQMEEARARGSFDSVATALTGVDTIGSEEFERRYHWNRAGVGIAYPVAVHEIGERRAETGPIEVTVLPHPMTLSGIGEGTTAGPVEHPVSSSPEVATHGNSGAK